MHLIIRIIVFYYVSLNNNHLKYLLKLDIVKNVLDVTFKTFLTNPSVHHTPTYVLGIGQTNTLGSIGSIDNLCENLY